jgi:hypothetical protein
MEQRLWKKGSQIRRYFIGGSDARIIMGNDEEALVRLWREKRGEVEPEDLSGNLLVQLGAVTEDLNRRWMSSGKSGIQCSAGWRPRSMGGFRAARPYSRPSSCCPGRFRRKRRCRNVCRSSNIICGWSQPDQPCCRSLPAAANGWRSPPMPIRSTSTSLSPRNASSGAVSRAESPPSLFGVEPPKPRIEEVRIVDMSTSNAWAEFAGIFIQTRDAHLEHERAKAELKGLVPDDAQQAIGHGICAKRSKAGAITFELLNPEDGNAAVK